ncbi:MAG: Dps family protein [Blastocatellia bacterium]
MKTQKTTDETRVISALQQELANTFLLYANYKKYHWESYGPFFRDLHLLFDEHGQAVHGLIDELGERIRILGGVAGADPRAWAERGTVRIAEGKQTMAGMLTEALENHQRVINGHRAAIAIATDENDPGTADLFTRNIQLHEKQAWFLREILEKSDGLLK